MTESFYAGVGSRETPLPVCAAMTGIAKMLYADGWWLASGGAKRADQAFEAGAGEHKQIFRPRHVSTAAHDLAEKFHPAWDRCSPIAKALHARNGLIMLGPALDSPVNFAVCWTPDGRASGGTGQALRIAAAYDIPVFNLYDPTADSRLRSYLTSLVW